MVSEVRRDSAFRRPEAECFQETGHGVEARHPRIGQRLPDGRPLLFVDASKSLRRHSRFGRLGGISRTENPVTCYQSVQKAGQRKYVVGRNRIFAGQHLHARVCGRQCPQHRRVEVVRVTSLPLLDSGHTEIEELGVAIRQDHDVAWLDVRVNDAAAMRILQRFAYLPHDAERSSDIDFPAVGRVQDIRQVAAFQPLHDDEIQVVVAIKIDEPHDI